MILLTIQWFNYHVIDMIGGKEEIMKVSKTQNDSVQIQCNISKNKDIINNISSNTTKSKSNSTISSNRCCGLVLNIQKNKNISSNTNTNTDKNTNKVTDKNSSNILPNPYQVN